MGEQYTTWSREAKNATEQGEWTPGREGQRKQERFILVDETMLSLDKSEHTERTFDCWQIT
jgi:hypothetical protein